MEIDAGITILFNNDGLKIEVHDRDSSICFLKICLTPKQTMWALSRLVDVDCKAECRNFDLVGKKMEWKTFKFPLPDGKHNYELSKREIINICHKSMLSAGLEKEGWISSDYFGGQDSFFDVNGKSWARTTIRRWIDK